MTHFRGFSKKQSGSTLFNDNLLGLHVVAADKAQHIDAGGHVGGRDGACTVSAQDDATEDVEDLEGAVAGDDELSVADKGEIITQIGAIGGAEHQLEP